MKSLFIAVLLFLFGYFIYLPGFSGGFIFDDVVNLSNLIVFEQLEGVEKYIKYILSFDVSPLKRPISTLSFLLHSQSWPANPFYFKFANFIFHSINAGLLYLANRYILVFLDFDKSQINIIALMAALIWFSHPYFVSTVLYSVQRMSILPVTFSLLSFVYYSRARLRMIERVDYNKFHLPLFISVYLFTTLAVLSKENAIVLPLLLLGYEKIIISRSTLPELKSKCVYFLFYLPIIIIAFALIFKFSSFMSGYMHRDFTAPERLLSQSRVLLLYTYHFAVPEIVTEGVFTDGFLKSTGLMKPISTLLSVITILGLLIVAFIRRNNKSVLSFVILFFFTANLIESTIIPLELYFEHRSYFPTLFIPLLFVLGLANVFKLRLKSFYIVMFLIVGYLSYLTFIKSNLWGGNIKLHKVTAEHFPRSLRANMIIANFYAEMGFADRALEIYFNSQKYHNNIELDANILNVKCRLNKLTKEDITNLIKKIEVEKFRFKDTLPFNNFIRTLLENKCWIENDVMRILDAVEANHGYISGNFKIIVPYNRALVLVNLNQFENAFQQLKFTQSFHNNIHVLEYTINIIDYFLNENQLIYAKKSLKSLTNLMDLEGFHEDGIYNRKKLNEYRTKINNLESAK